MIESKVNSTTCYHHSLVSNSTAWSRTRRIIVPLTLMFADYIAIVAAMCTAYIIRNDILSELGPWSLQAFDISRIYIYLVIPFAYLFFMNFAGIYTRRLLFWQKAEKLFKISIYAMLLVLVVMYLVGGAGDVSRTFMLTAWLLGFVYLVILQHLAKKVLIITGLWQIPAVLIGAGKTAELLIKSFQEDSGLGYKIVGLVEDNPNVKLQKHYPVIGNFHDAEEAILSTGVKDVLIAAPGLGREELLKLVYQLQPHVNNITFVPDLFGVPVGAMELDTLFNERAVLLKIRNNLANEYNRLIKRIFDLTVTIIGTIAIIPFLFLISALIYIDNPGPIIFSHRRVGRDGNEFPCYKFRTMIVNSQEALERHLAQNPSARQEWEQDFKLKSDPRITKLGAFLRKTSLDELPQLFNVITGEMSLVGPRPIVAQEIEKYDKYIQDYYLVRPGITGMWQVSGRNDVDYNERVQLDSWYVRNWSLWLDVMLIFKTVAVVLRGKGAY